MARDELDKWFNAEGSGIREMRRKRAQKALDKRNKRAIIVHRDGEVAVNCSDSHEDQRLGFSAAELDVRGATRCRDGRMSGTPVYTELPRRLR